MSHDHKIAALAVILTVLASPSLAASQKSSHHHSAHYGARGGAVYDDQEGFGAPGSTPNGYYRSTRSKHYRSARH